MRRDRPAPHRFECNRHQTEAERVGDQLVPLQRQAQRGEQPDFDPTEGEPADECSKPPPPEASGQRIHRNDAETLVLGGQQEMADDDRHTDREKDDEIAEHHLAKEGGPIER